jgi:hypothetical protein
MPLRRTKCQREHPTYLFGVIAFAGATRETLREVFVNNFGAGNALRLGTANLPRRTAPLAQC